MIVDNSINILVNFLSIFTKSSHFFLRVFSQGYVSVYYQHFLQSVPEYLIFLYYFVKPCQTSTSMNFFLSLLSRLDLIDKIELFWNFFETYLFDEASSRRPNFSFVILAYLISLNCVFDDHRLKFQDLNLFMTWDWYIWLILQVFYFEA